MGYANKCESTEFATPGIDWEKNRLARWRYLSVLTLLRSCNDATCLLDVAHVETSD